MSWDFETDPEFQEELDWVDAFVREEVEPLDFVVRPRMGHAGPRPPASSSRRCRISVRERGLWATHLGPHLGGAGLRSGEAGAAQRDPRPHATAARSCSAARRPTPGTPRSSPTTARRVSEAQRYLDPLLRNDIVSAFSMTEPQGGSDPTQFVTRAELDGDEWVINGEKWFSSHANFASFLIVLAVTDPDQPAHNRMSMFVVPADTPGVQHRQERAGVRPPRRPRHALVHPLRERADPERPSAGEPRRGLRRRADPPRRRPHPPCDADRRPGQAGVRHDVRAGAVSRDEGRGTGPQAVRAGDDRRLVDPDRAVPPARPAHRMEDRQVQRLPARARRHLGGEGGDAAGAPRRRGPGTPDCTARSAHRTRCRSVRWSSSRSTWAWPTARPRCTR